MEWAISAEKRFVALLICSALFGVRKRIGLIKYRDNNIMATPGYNFPVDGEIVEFQTEEEPKWVTVRLEDGSVIQIKMEIVSVMKNGNDPNTGVPNYMVQATNIIRMVKIPKELMKRGSSNTNDDNKGQQMYR